MKTVKNLLVFVIALMLVIPFTAFASEKYNGYTAMDLEESLEAEEIKADLDDYEPADDAINVYMFRGQGCPHCQEFLEFAASIVDDYGKYFNLVSFEVWNDQTNAQLFQNVATALGEEAGGVPFIVIGDQTFAGYSTEFDQKIKTAIKDLYDTSTEERYDVFDHLGETGTTKTTGEEEKTDSKNDAIVGVVTVLIIGGIVAAAIVTRRNSK